MKFRQILYNSIGLGVATLAAVVLVLMLTAVAHLNGLPNGRVLWSLVDILILLALLFGVGGCALGNLIVNRLDPKRTMTMIVIYTLSCLFLPMAIWGVIELHLEAKRHQRNRMRPHEAQALQPSFSFRFYWRAATLSWAVTVMGLAFLIFAPSFVRPPILDSAALVYLFVMAFDLALGIVALMGAREHGGKGLLVPAIAGISVNGVLLILCLLSLAAGLGSHELGLRQPAGTNSPANPR